MPDIARLGIKIESDQAKLASNRLDDLYRSGSKAERATDGVSRKAGSANQNFGRLKGSMAGTIAKVGGLTALAAGAGMLAKNSMQAAAEMERMKVEFGVFMQDAEAGAEMFDKIQEFSANTPLAMEQLSGVARQLMSFGSAADDVLDQMQMLGDAALGDAQKMQTLARAFGRVQARGRATMEEVNMAMEAGLPIIEELASNMDVTKEKIFEMVSAGEVEFKDFEEALADMTSEGGKFNNGMDKLADTFQGRMSTAMDNIKILGGTMFEPALEGAKDFVTWVSDAASGLTEFIEEQRRLRDIRTGDVEGKQISESEYQAAKEEIASFQSDIDRYDRTIGRLQTELKYTKDEAMKEMIRGRIEQQREYLQLLMNQISDEKEVVRQYEKQREIKEETAEAAKDAADKSKPPWWADYEFGVLEGQSGVEEKIKKRFKDIEEQAALFADTNVDFDAAEQKAQVVKDIITNLLTLDPDEAGGRFFADDNTIQNLKALLQTLEESDVEKTAGSAGPLAAWESNHVDKRISSMKEEAQALSDELAPAQEKYNKEVQRLEELRPWLTAEEYQQALEQLKDEYKDTSSASEAFIASMEELGTKLGEQSLREVVDVMNELGRSFFDAQEGAMSFEDSMHSIVSSIISNLPYLLLNAGLQLLSTPAWPAGLGLIAASGIVSIGAGAYSEWESQQTQNAHGNVYDKNGLQTFASGGVVNKPTLFPFASGTGLMGEAGPEAIMPLKRNSQGDLGVSADSPGVVVNIINNSGEQVQQREKKGKNGGKEIEVIVGNIAKSQMGEGKFDDVMKHRYGVKPQGVAR